MGSRQRGCGPTSAKCAAEPQIAQQTAASSVLRARLTDACCSTTLMSSNPGGTRKRRGQQQPSATIDLTASDASRTPKRARSSAKRAAAAAAVGAVFDLTDEPAPAPQPSDSRHSGHRKSAAKPRRILKSPQLAPAPRAEPASAGSGGADQAASSRADQKAARRATKAAAVAAGTAAFIAEEASRAAEAAEAEAEPEAEADMFFRSRKREAAEPAAAAAAAVVVPAAEVAKPGDELPAWHSMKASMRSSLSCHQFPCGHCASMLLPCLSCDTMVAWPQRAHASWSRESACSC